MLRYKFDTTPERSELMKKIKSKNTTPELLLTKELWKHGIRYRRYYSKLPGIPDIAITKHKIAIFVDGEFWHGYNWEDKKTKIKSNSDYWINKIEKNMERDKRFNNELHILGWKVLRFWEKDIKKNLYKCILAIVSEIDK